MINLIKHGEKQQIGSPCFVESFLILDGQFIVVPITPPPDEGGFPREPCTKFGQPSPRNGTSSAKIADMDCGVTLSKLRNSGMTLSKVAIPLALVATCADFISGHFGASMAFQNIDGLP